MSGTDLAYWALPGGVCSSSQVPIALRSCYAMSGSIIVHGAIAIALRSCYAMPGTVQRVVLSPYALATPCP
eukprot:3625815-Rhodomonas_salina.1